MKPMKTMISVLALTAIAGTAAAGDFGTLDANANGQVDFQEYKAHAIKDGKTVTLAAQEFTSMTQGDATLTEGEFLIAEANASQNLDFGSDLIAAPMASESFETVPPAEIFADVPQAVEAIDADTSVGMEMSNESTPTEIEVETDVAGDVKMSDEWTAPEIAEPDITAPEIMVPEILTEPDTDLNIALDTKIESDLNDGIDVPQAPELPDAPVID